jgi:hypothetical protein
MAEELDDLFNSSLDSKMDFLNDKKAVNADGIYRIDMKKPTIDKKKGYRSVIRFLPNLTKAGKMEQVSIEKVAHYVNIKNVKELSGWFDSPKNFNEKCALTDCYYSMTNSKNAILVEKAKCLNYSKKYYSYVLVMEDEHQPELVGKIMVFQYGKTIRDKILAEKTGEITGTPCNVFDIVNGKDFVLLVKEIQTGDETYPDYKNSMFKPEKTSLPIYFEDKKAFKNAPVLDGKIDPKAQSMVRDFLLKRDFELEDFAPKHLTDEQQGKLTEIINYLTGKSSNSMAATKASTEDFDFEETLTGKTTPPAAPTSSEEDFFKDF